MQQRGRLVGLGCAMVNEKIQKQGINFPKGRELYSFLDGQRDSIREVGGVTCNILSALTLYSPDMGVHLIACTGKDERGKFYQSKVRKRLGTLQKNPNEPTGIVVFAPNKENVVTRIDSYLGAAETVTIDKDEIEQNNKLFISDLMTLRLPKVFKEADRMLLSVKKSGCNFFLNLAGLNPEIAPVKSVVAALTALKKEPDIVTGNEGELNCLTNSSDMPTLITQVFPNTRLLIITLGKNGSLVRFEGIKCYIPPYEISEDKTVDQTGAGDTFAGIMLGELYKKPYSRWSHGDVAKACITASYGASIVVQTTRFQLSNKEMARVRSFNLKTDFTQMFYANEIGLF